MDNELEKENTAKLELHYQLSNKNHICFETLHMFTLLLSSKS
jgi:hypothetical protein